MSNTFGKNFKITIYGESHGKSIGVIIDGIPSGITLDFDLIREEMYRRRPGKDNVSTTRKEKDKVLIQSGYFNDHTTGTPLCGIIENTNKKSKDYSKLKDQMRPSHGDYPGRIKYGGFNDYRGGGQFSGRLTAPLVFAGAIAKQILRAKDIHIGSHILSIGGVEEKPFELKDLKEEVFNQLKKEKLPTLDMKSKERMEEEILKFKRKGDSIGGIVEGGIINLPIGLGEPLFDSFESHLSQLIFSIPGIKGIAFGKGFELSKLPGSKGNDPYYYNDKGKVQTKTNNNGGILGGLTTGMPVTFKVAFKGTPSISKVQETINVKTKENIKLSIEGRHDPCIVPRGLVVVEAASAIVALDLLIESGR
jgi:chorismate synthase